MEKYNDTFTLPLAIHPLKVIIIGAGIAGLSSAIGLTLAGHDVSIYEQYREIGEVGAGIQMGPNAARILGRFGLLGKLMEKGTVMEGNSLRRWRYDEELGNTRGGENVAKKGNPPLSVIHRGDLQAILLQKVKELGICIHLNAKVLRADPGFSGYIQVQTGEWLRGDIVICADGIRSSIRKQIATARGFKEERLKNDEKAMKLLSQNIGMRWMGPGGHIMAYPVKNNTVYNMVLLHPQRPSQGSNENWCNPGSKIEMLEFYKDWNPMVQALLSYVPDGEIREWTLNSHSPLPNWYENRCVLVGDACHPMLPYVGQGAAQAIEDAGVLTCALSLIGSDSANDIEMALRIYELVRKERGERVQNSAAETRKALHLSDGEEQMKRDEAIRNSALGKGSNPDKWADRKWQEFMYDVDVMRECVDGWNELVERAERIGAEILKENTDGGLIHEGMKL